MKKRKSHLEDTMFNRIRWAGFPLPTREYKFSNSRKWRFDFAWPDLKLAVEAEGAVFTRGRHTRGSGFIKDTEKYNEAAKMGWVVLRYTSQTIDHLIHDLETFFNQISI